MNKPFFLYVAFHDPHRCSHGDYGGFCQNYGNGRPGMGTIDDWRPQYFRPSQVIVPYFIPDTPAARLDIAAQYTVVNRMDQGIGLILDEFERRDLLDTTLIIYTSDNGIPFPSGRTNLYDPGMKEPMIVSSPDHRHSWGARTSNLVSLLDVTPTILEWFDLQYPRYKIFRGSQTAVTPTGVSLLSHLRGNTATSERNALTIKGGVPSRAIFSSHNLHEITMYYPMRMVRTHRYKLIHNLNFKMPFPIDQDYYVSPTYQDLLNNTVHERPTKWYKNITGYYYRSQLELFDVINDPHEMNNLAYLKEHTRTTGRLKLLLKQWMNQTDDPWLCSPDRILEYEITDKHTHVPKCFLLYNDL